MSDTNSGPEVSPAATPAEPAAPAAQPAPPATPPVPPVAPPVAYAPVPPVPPSGGFAAPQPTQPPKRGKAWIWWTIGIVVVIGALVTSCAVVPIVLLGDFGGEDTDLEFGKGVGVIRVDGVIAGTGSTFDGYVTPESFKGLLDQAEDDDSVKAVVLRIDSPGGTVAASEEIASYAKDFSKPLVVSIGDVGASGAYMLASQADEIWAMPGSAVGSIGVISEIPNVSGLLDKVGVDFQVVTAGKYKDAGSPYRKLTDEELALIQGEVDDAYEQFIGIVADGRGMSRPEVRKLATGWAWNGERAEQLGLVDHIGTMDDALDAAAKLGGIKGGDYDVIEIQDDEFDQLFSSFIGLSEKLDNISAALDTTRESAVERSLAR